MRKGIPLASQPWRNYWENHFASLAGEYPDAHPTRANKQLQARLATAQSHS